MAKAVNSRYREITKKFDSLAGSKGLWEVWNDVIQIIATSISNVFDSGERMKQREKIYCDTVAKYSDEDMKTVIEIFNDIINRLEENQDQDLLGDIYMNLNFGSAALGQFFTPYSVSRAMAECAVEIEQVKSEIDKKGYIEINEPCCGGGANIIAALMYLKKNGINYQTDCFVVCQDLSYITALMCYIQLSLLGAAAIVKIGNTLTDPVIKNQSILELDTSVWLTPMYQNELWKGRRIARLFDETVMR